MLELDGAMVTAMRPHGLEGRPAADLSSSDCQVAPPSVDLNRPLPLGAFGPSPPERKAPPLPRKSHMPPERLFGFERSSESIEQPVEALAPLSAFVQFLPPSEVL